MREWDLLRHVYRSNDALNLDPRVLIPPGDDMGAVALLGVPASAPPSQISNPKSPILVTVDQVADGIHVNVSNTPLEKIGRKAITRNLSDVAAMAAQPLAAVAAASLPRDWSEEQATRLFDAMRQTAAAYDCPLIGGDISIWNHPLIVSVTVLAQPAGIEPVLRRGAQPGDTIYVTGQLGGSAEPIAAGVAGVSPATIKTGQTPVPPPPPYIHHLDFEPRIALARKLAGDPVTRPHCMIDLSDGLASDLRHLCEASNVWATLAAERLPLAPAARQATQRTGHPAWQHAVGDGEDYELLFTVSPQAARAMPDQIDNIPITAIGTIRPMHDDHPRILLTLSDHREVDLDSLGWEHHT